MKAKPTVEEGQAELLPIEHRTLQPKRLRSGKHPHNYVNAEAIYLHEWRKFQKEYHNRLLGMLLAPDDEPRGIDGRVRPVLVSRRDAVVAASLIQWLGTAVGAGFVRRCEHIVAEAQRLRLELSIARSNAKRATDTRTPLQRHKARLDAVRRRMADATKEG